jgi:hypothetical protein
MCPANVCAITFIIDVTVIVPARPVNLGLVFSPDISCQTQVLASYPTSPLLLSPLASFKIWELDYVNLS